MVCSSPVLAEIVKSLVEQLDLFVDDRMHRLAIFRPRIERDAEFGTAENDDVLIGLRGVSARLADALMLSASWLIVAIAAMPSQLMLTATAASSRMTARILVMILTRASKDMDDVFPVPRDSNSSELKLCRENSHFALI